MSNVKVRIKFNSQVMHDLATTARKWQKTESELNLGSSYMGLEPMTVRYTD